MELKQGEKDNIYKKVRRKSWSYFSRKSNLLYELGALNLYTNNDLRKLRSFSNKHLGQRCFVIGNGPSLNLLDLTKLKNEFTFGVNAIYLNYDKMGFYPTYYVVEDTFVAEDRAEEINNYKESIKFFGHYLKYCLRPDENSIVLNVIKNYKPYRNFPHFSTNSLRKIYVGGSVTYLSLQLAYFMGFSEVYMIGFDHNYEIPKDAILTNNNVSIMSTSDDPNHFHPDYFGKGKRWHDPKVDRMEKGFLKAKKYFEMDDRKIYNATFGGHLEVFQRKDYSSLF